MPWTCNLGSAGTFDFAGLYTVLLPTLTGTLFIPPPGTSGASLADTGAGSISPFSVTFPKTAAAPPDPGSFVLTDPGSTTPGGGDFFRSGIQTTLPKSPASVAWMTLPTAPTALGIAALTAILSSKLPKTFPLERSVTNVGGILTSLGFAPTSVVVSTATLGIGTATGGPVPLTIALTGTLVGKSLIFIRSTIAFTFGCSLTPLPSRDSADKGRVLALTAASPTFTAKGVNRALSGALAGAVSGLLVPVLESIVNSMITSAVTPALASKGLVASPTAVVCAQRVSVIVTSSLPPGVLSMALILSDMQGPAFTLLVKDVRMNAAVSPDPAGREGKSTKFTITVTSAKDGSPISGATATLTTFDQTKNTVIVHGDAPSGADGKITLTATLRNKVVVHSGVDVAPSLKVTPPAPAPGASERFDPVTVVMDGSVA